jgi:hypothetical protein
MVSDSLYAEEIIQQPRYITTIDQAIIMANINFEGNGLSCRYETYPDENAFLGANLWIESEGRNEVYGFMLCPAEYRYYKNNGLVNEYIKLMKTGELLANIVDKDVSEKAYVNCQKFISKYMINWKDHDLTYKSYGKNSIRVFEILPCGAYNEEYTATIYFIPNTGQIYNAIMVYSHGDLKIDTKKLFADEDCLSIVVKWINNYIKPVWLHVDNKSDLLTLEQKFVLRADFLGKQRLLRRYCIYISKDTIINTYEKYVTTNMRSDKTKAVIFEVDAISGEVITWSESTDMTINGLVKLNDIKIYFDGYKGYFLYPPLVKDDDVYIYRIFK